MGFYLALTDGTNTVDLSSAVLDYTPINAPDSADAVSETIRVRLTGGISSVTPQLNTIGKIITQAQRWSARKIQPRVFLKFDPFGTTYSSTTTKRSLIITATITPGIEVLQRQQLGNGIFEFDLYVTRVNWWERDTEIVLGAIDGQPSTGADQYLTTSNSVVTVSTNETLATADGIMTAYGGFITNKLILTRTFIYVTAVISGVTQTYYLTINFANPSTASYTGGGNSLSVDLTSGYFAVIFANPPDNGTSIILNADTGYINSLEINPTIYNTLLGGGSTNETVTGDLPAPAIIRAVNLSGVLSVSEFYCGSMYSEATTDLDLGVWPRLSLPTTDATMGSTDSTVVSDTDCSHSNRIDAALTTDNTTLMASWTFTSDEIKAMGGRWFLPFIKFSGTVNTGDITNIRYAWTIQDSIGGTIWTGSQYRPDTTVERALRQIGMVQLPPWKVFESDTPEVITLGLLGQRVSAGTKTASIDFVFLMPTDSYGQYNVVGNGSLGLLIDGADEKFSLYTASDERGTVYRQFGDVMLYPGKTQRLYMLWQAATTGENALWNWQHKINLAYRPRRRSL